MAVTLADLPAEMIQLILDKLQLEHVLGLMLYRSRHLITSVLGHRTLRTYFMDIKTFQDAVNLAEIFATMRDLSRFLRNGGRGDSIKQLAIGNHDDQVQNGLCPCRDCGIKRLVMDRRKAPLAPYASSSMRGTSWDRGLCATDGLLIASIDSWAGVTAAVPDEPMNFRRCLEHDQKSSTLMRFLGAMKCDRERFATLSTSTAVLPRLFRQLTPKARQIVKDLL